MVCANNENPDAKCFCIDVEYEMSQMDSRQLKFGRFDIVTVSKEKQKNGKYGCAAAAMQMYKYLCDSFRSSSFNVQRILKEENIKKCEIMALIFFSETNSFNDNIIIEDIIDDETYTKRPMSDFFITQKTDNTVAHLTMNTKTNELDTAAVASVTVVGKTNNIAFLPVTTIGIATVTFVG